MNKFEFFNRCPWADDGDYNKYINLIIDSSKTESLADHERHVKILNTKQKVYALPTPYMREIAKNILKGDYMAFLRLAKCDSYEETTIIGLVIAGIADLPLQTELFVGWLPQIDNWSSCDCVVSGMKSLKKSKNKAEYFKHYLDMCFDEREFVARFGIVCLMSNFLEEQYIDQILDMCEQVTHPAYYVKMAVAWLISFAFMKFKEKTYVLLNKRSLDKFTQNKAICKIRDSYQVDAKDKEAVKALRIK